MQNQNKVMPGQLEPVVIAAIRSSVESLMSALSEENWAAGWLIGTETSLWKACQKYPEPFEWGMGYVDLERVKDLIALTSFLGEWFDGENWIPLEEWEKAHGTR